MSATAKSLGVAGDGGQESLAYYEYGQGRPILLLHGNPGTHADLEPLAEKLAAEGFRCIVPDRPGHGRNVAVPNPAGQRYRTVELLAGLIDAAADGRALVFGFSIGAYYALKLAIACPRKVDGLALAAPYLFAPPGEKPSGLADLARFPLLGGLLRSLLPGLARKKLAEHQRNLFAPGPGDEGRVADAVARFATADAILAVMADKNEFIRFPPERAKLAALAVPTLVVAAGADRIAPADVHVDPLLHDVQGVERVTLEGAPHEVVATRLEPLARAVIDFYGKLKPAHPAPRAL